MPGPSVRLAQQLREVFGQVREHLGGLVHNVPVFAIEPYLVERGTGVLFPSLDLFWAVSIIFLGCKDVQWARECIQVGWTIVLDDLEICLERRPQEVSDGLGLEVFVGTVPFDECLPETIRWQHVHHSGIHVVLRSGQVWCSIGRHVDFQWHGPSSPAQLLCHFVHHPRSHAVSHQHERHVA
eukprot:scaffold541_cov335-Pavlova_lutheri.AAC.29